MPTLLETWIAVIVIFMCGIMVGFEVRRLQDEKKKQSADFYSPQFRGVNCMHTMHPIVDTDFKINPNIEDIQKQHEGALEQYRKEGDYKGYRTHKKKVTVLVQCRNGRPVAMKEIYNGKGV